MNPFFIFLNRRSAGFENKESLSYEDFKTMMKEFKGDFLAIGLDCKGARQNYLDSTTNVARWENRAKRETLYYGMEWNL